MEVQVLSTQSLGPQAVQVVVRCPHCNGKHKHGLEGSSRNGTWRSPDCGGPEYRVRV